MAPAARRDFHVMAKPTGALCNLDCAYCFFLSKQSLYPGGSCHMSDEVMESYIRLIGVNYFFGSTTTISPYQRQLPSDA